MPYPEEATGLQVDSADSWTKLHKRSFPLKDFGDHDVDVKIEACGICSNDIHTISGGWGTQHYPLCVGHETLSTGIRVGPKVTVNKEGQLVGIGAQSYSCLECRQCKMDNEIHCIHQVDTYGQKWPDTNLVSKAATPPTFAPKHWVFPIPKALGTSRTASMLRRSNSLLAPRPQRLRCRQESWHVGLGGIGHFGVLFAKALGADVWASHARTPKRLTPRKWAPTASSPPPTGTGPPRTS